MPGWVCSSIKASSTSAPGLLASLLICSWSMMFWTSTSRGLQRTTPSSSGSLRTWNAAWPRSSSRQELRLLLATRKLEQMHAAATSFLRLPKFDACECCQLVLFCFYLKLKCVDFCCRALMSAPLLAPPSSCLKASRAWWTAMLSMPIWSASMQSLSAHFCLSSKRLVDG